MNLLKLLSLAKRLKRWQRRLDELIKFVRAKLSPADRQHVEAELLALQRELKELL